VVLAASTPANCFDYAYRAAKIAIEHMTPVILLSDGYLANGSELWHIPAMADLPDIEVPSVKDNDPNYFPYHRRPDKLARYWALPGQEGLRHRVGGLEKADITGEVSHDAMNHQIMVELRDEKVKKVAEFIPEQEVIGEQEGELLVIGWGGTYGALVTAVDELRGEGRSVSLAQFNYINPLPVNTGDILKRFRIKIVCELNMGQFATYLRSKHPDHVYFQYNKVKGLPFMISELKARFNEILDK
jgi:2-oxoglutarate ferredoxin oxidoreductase subunit alpha